jgi:hypothetical protein
VAVATVLMDRAIALWGLVWFVALLGAGFWLTGALEGPARAASLRIVTAAVVIVAVTGAVWLLLGLLPERRAERFAGRLSHIPKVGGSAAEFWRAVWMYRCRQGSVALALLMSWVGFVGFVLAFYCAACTLHDGDPANPLPSLTQHFLLVPVGMVIMAIPLFPGGAGVGELGFGKLYSLFGFNEAQGVMGSLVQRVLTWVLAVTGYRITLCLERGWSAPETEELRERHASRTAARPERHTGSAVPHGTPRNGEGALGPVAANVCVGSHLGAGVRGGQDAVTNL